MILTLDKININTEVLSQNRSNDFLFLLHGFTGSANDWKESAALFEKNYNIIAVDLIGHGESSSPDELIYYSADDICTQLFQVIRKFTSEPISLLGYSMGGRAALNFAVKFPLQIKSLILESASAGIRNEKERNDRIKRDSELADFIEKHPMEDFIDYWMNLEIFSTQKRFSNERLEQIRKMKIIRNNPVGLSNSLRGFSSGVMTPLYSKLKTFKARTLLVSGELDSKFTMLNSKMVSLFNNARHIVIKNAGHNTHLEEPKRFIKTVNNFLRLSL
jgi:2-succinyl-6-hydroxy-2,4-cyclohexadiene-1-carboxylate synthase